MRTFNIEKEFLNKSNCGTGIIYNLETELFDVSLDIKTDHLIKVTWQELVNLKNLSALEPGVFYRITDYEFTSTDPEVINAGHRFDIIVLALSEDTLSEDARAIQHEFTEEEKEIYSEEELHYFDTSNLAAWKLKYSLDGTSSRFSWAPGSYLDTIVFSSRYYGGNYDTYAYKRASYKDEQGYYAYEKDGDVVYIKSEKATFGEDIFIKNESGLIVPRTPGKRGWQDSYILEISKVDYKNNRTYFYIYNTYGGSNTAYGWNKDSEFYTDLYAFYIDEIDPNKFFGKRVIRETILPGNEYITDLSDSKIYTLNRTLPGGGSDEGKLITGVATGWSYNIDDYYEEIEPGKYMNGSDVRWYAGESLNYVKETKEAVKYKGTIYGMIDEFENDCEYDFKNALITGKYSLFDPEQFYYTFTNTVEKNPRPLKDNGTKVKLEPGTYSFLGSIPFKKYITTLESGLIVKPIVSNSDYESFDLYACISEKSEIDPETNQTIYPVKVLYDKKGEGVYEDFKTDKFWYADNLPVEFNSDNPTNCIVKIYCKDLTNNTVISFNTLNLDYLYNAYGRYVVETFTIITGVDWAYILPNGDTINLNYNYSSWTFDDSTVSLFEHEASRIECIKNSEGIVGLKYKEFDTTGIFRGYKWFTEGMPETETCEGEEDAEFYFTKSFEITEPMWAYLQEPYSSYPDSYIDIVKGDNDNDCDTYVLLSPDEILTPESKMYHVGSNEVVEYKASIIGNQDTSKYFLVSDNYISNPECVKVKLRYNYDNYTIASMLPRTIIHKTANSELECCYSFITNCDKVIAKNVAQIAGFSHYFKDPLFLKDCYASEFINCHNCQFIDVDNSKLFNIDCSQDSENKSKIELIKYSIILNTHNCNITYTGSSGNYYSGSRYNLYINRLRDKNINLEEFPENYDGITHIRSEEDLTITV